MFLLIALSRASPSFGIGISIHLMFLLILLPYNLPFQSIKISIHLMFLLISLEELQESLKLHFNTSHVSINHHPIPEGCSAAYISIHLMFLLIVTGGIWKDVRRAISIHLMFLLIGQIWIGLTMGNYFNTSHVSINQQWRKWRPLPSAISIHLMFLLIKIRFRFLWTM